MIIKKSKYGYIVLHGNKAILVSYRILLLRIRTWVTEEFLKDNTILYSKISFLKGFCYYEFKNEVRLKKKYFFNDNSKLYFKTRWIAFELLLPHFRNYFKKDVSFAVFDYAYSDMEKILEDYEVCTVRVKHESDKILISSSLADSIISVWIAKTKLELVLDYQDALLFVEGQDVTNLSNFEILLFLSNNFKNFNEITLVIKSSKPLNQEKYIIVYPILNTKYDDYYLNTILKNSKWKSPIF